MTKTEAVKFLDRVTSMDIAEPCKYGHLHCSDEEGGSCIDEVLSNFPELGFTEDIEAEEV